MRGRWVMVLVLANAIWNTWVFLSDVWPARMAPVWVAQTLQRLSVSSFATYQTSYNGALVHVLPPPQEYAHYQIRYITTLDDVEDGYVVVPGTSSKAVNMESQRESVQDGDFDRDPVLNQLLQTKTISRFSVACFKTFGTSRFWVHESEVTSYRDLILREITDEDRWRGQAWILDARKLRAERGVVTPRPVLQAKPALAGGVV